MKIDLPYTSLFLLLWGCSQPQSTSTIEETSVENIQQNSLKIAVRVDNWNASSDAVVKSDPQQITAENWLNYAVEVPKTGRYRLSLKVNADSGTTLWMEDYADNSIDRTFNITGDQKADNSIVVDGIPLAEGIHQIKLHCKTGKALLNEITFTLLQEIPPTPTLLTSEMEGSKWDLVWSDEFDGTGLPDSTKWTYNIGDWGWGNHELQYYTQGHLENARQENGNLIIEAHKVDEKWTSARLTTQGKVAFKYGKMVIRAKVPSGRGTWSAGWLLGDTYKDEMSWPKCGEIDILECVGYEINDTTGSGFNHTSCHTPAYYFKKNNQITGKIALENMTTEFHDYTIIWYPDRIEGFVDDIHYYTYDKNKTPEEWPFATPQNLILNLAIGGGWGGAKGIDATLTQQTLYIDHIRYYQLID